MADQRGRRNFKRPAKVLETELWRRACHQTSRIAVDTSSALSYNAPIYLMAYCSQLLSPHRSMHMKNAQDRLPLMRASITWSLACTPFLLRPQLLTRV
jgi:hypothetical protein